MAPITADFTVIILVVFFGFVTLAFALLAPVYVFLDREEKISRYWTKEAVASRMQAAAERAASGESPERLN